MPQEKSLLERCEIRGGLLRYSFESKRFGSGQNVAEASYHRKGGLAVVVDGDPIAIRQLKVGLVPFQDVLSPFVFSKQDLGTKEADLEIREVVSLALEDGDAS
jgi:hypothetical protein